MTRILGILSRMHTRYRCPPDLRIVPVLLGVILLSAAPTAFARSASQAGSAPRLQATSAIMMDEQTGTVLFQENADAIVPPASLTKLMTLHIALEQIAKGKLDPKQMIVPVAQAWAENMPKGSSLMFLGPNQRLSVGTLLRGLVVPSGNDAAYELAYLIAGSVPAFAEMMNAEARRLGFDHMHFVEPSGISAENTITARQYAEFCRVFIHLHPNALRKYLSVKEFTYPEPDNLTDGSHAHPITQYNRNKLLWGFAGTDGLKTGYIDESGYNMAATAHRDGMRLIAVILGVRPNAEYSGIVLRAREAEELLNYGFSRFEKVPLQYPQPAPVTVWKGSVREVGIAPAEDPVVVIPKTEVAGLKGVIEQKKQVIAPIRKGDSLGALIYSSGDTVIARFPLVAQSDVPEGGFFRRLFDSIALFFRRLFGAPVP